MRDPFNQATDRLKGESKWIGPYMEMNSSTVVRPSAKLVAFNQLAVNLKTLEHGYYGRASRTRSEEAALDIDRLAESGKQWTDEFLLSARDEYSDLAPVNPDDDPDYVPSQRPHTLAYNGTMLRILAGCYHEWRKKYPSSDISQLAEFISKMDFDPNQRQGLLVESGILDLQQVTLVARRQEVQAAISAIVEGAFEASVDADGEETTV